MKFKDRKEREVITKRNYQKRNGSGNENDKERSKERMSKNSSNNGKNTNASTNNVGNQSSINTINVEHQHY